MKPLRTKTPPAPFVRASVVRAIPESGLTVGARVLVRRSRSGGWRVVGSTSQAVIAERGIATFVAAERREDGSVVYAVDQTLADRHAMAVIREQEGCWSELAEVEGWT